MEFITVLAELTGSEWFAPLTQFGVSGAMLYWFAVKVEARMKGMETAVDRMAKASLLQILSYEKNQGTIRIQAETMMAEIEQKAGNRP